MVSNRLQTVAYWTMTVYHVFEETEKADVQTKFRVANRRKPSNTV